MDERAVLAACRRYKLERTPRRARGRLGDEHAIHTGSSLEFHGYRAYTAGDDPRRVDWQVYGRTSQLQVKQYEAEIRPHVDVLLDTSASMSIADGRKPELARELAAFAWHSARFAGNAARLHALGASAEMCEIPSRLAAADSGRSGCVMFEAPARTARGLRPGGMRILISDFLVRSGTQAAVRELANTAAQLVVIMVLGPWEARPTPSGSEQLHDLETAGECLAEVSEETIARYLQRLGRLRDDLRSTCAGAGATFLEVVCDLALEPTLRRDLLPAGIVSPA